MKSEKQSTPVSITEIERLLGIGDQAWYRYQVTEGMEAWQRGLELIDQAEHGVARAYLSWQLWERLIRVRLARGWIAEANEALENLERQAEMCAAAYPQLPILTYLWRARVVRRQRDICQAQQFVHEALCMVEGLPPGETKQRILAAAQLEHGITALEVSENHVAISALLQARTLYQQLGGRAGEAHSLMAMGRVYGRMSIPEQAITHYQEADIIFQDTPNDPTVRYLQQLGWGSALSTAERYQEAIVHYQTALDLARRLGSEPYVARCLNNMGVILRRQGKPQEALELYEEALELFRHLHDRFGIAVIVNNMGEVYLDLEDLQKALPALKEALRMGKEVNFRLMLPETHYLLSVAYVLLDRPSTAFDHAEKALQLAEEIGNLTYAGMAYRALGIAAAALERKGRLPAVVPSEGPEAYFTTSMEVLSGMNQRYEQARTLLAWGKYLRESRESTRQAKGESYLKRATQQFDRLQLPVPAFR